jgi:uncharacterized ubiquitin-like protein YukD
VSRFKTLLFTLFVFLFSINLSAIADDQQWLAYGKVDTPEKIWNAIKQTKEFGPVLEAGLDKISAILPQEIFDSPSLKAINKSWYFAVSKEPGDYYETWYIWHKNQENENILFNISNSFTEGILVPPRPDFVAENKKKKHLAAFPKVFLQLNNRKMIDFRIRTEIIVDELEQKLGDYVKQQNNVFGQRCSLQIKRLERELQKDPDKKFTEKELKACPLNGNYKIDRNSLKVTCDHRPLSASFSDLRINENIETGLALIKILKNSSNFAISFDSADKQLSIKINYKDEVVENKKHLKEWSVTMNWFKMPDNFVATNPDSNLQVIFTIPAQQIISMLRQRGNNLDFFEDPLKQLSFKPVCVEFFGGISRFNMFVSLTIKIPLKFKTVKKIISNLEKMGMPVVLKNKEMHGRMVLSAVLSFSGQFNNPDVDQNPSLFLFADKFDNTLLALGDNTATRFIMTESGETEAIDLWSDLKDEQVKLALAYRLDLLARSLLSAGNLFLFERETSICEMARAGWIKKHKTEYENLGVKDGKLPESLKKCCPRGGIIFTPQSITKINCAIHSSHNSYRITDQVFSADIPFGRWLRVYLRKTLKGSELIFDFKQPQGGK